MQGRFPVLTPGQVRVRPVIQQPVWPRRVVGPQHHVHERRHPAGDTVHVQAVAMQQLERIEIAASAGNMSSHTIRWIGSGFEQHFRER